MKINAPTVCPFCGAPVVKMLDDGANIYCSNPECSARKLAKLNYFVTKECMNIDGLSEKTLKKLTVPVGFLDGITEWPDLYEVKSAAQFAEYGLGDKTAQKIYDEIQKSRTAVGAANVLMALGIPMIGKVTAAQLLDHFRSIKTLAEASYEDIASVEGVGAVAARSVYDYMQSAGKELQYVYTYLQYELSDEVKEAASDKLAGMTILATGTLSNFTRDGIKESVVANGGKYASGVSGKLTFLIVGEDAGASKIEKAKSLGVKMISEEEYLNIIQ